MTQDATPAAGMPVFSNDGAHLGHIAAISHDSGWFKLSTPQAPDFWLRLSEIQETGPRYVLLKLRRADVLRRKWEGPEPEPPSISAIGTDRDFADRLPSPGAG